MTMKFVFLTHSLISDWNHGNAHFQRGVISELVARGYRAVACEPAEGWSLANLLAERGPEAIGEFHRRFPELESSFYKDTDDVDAAVDDADVVVVHEWTSPELVAHLGRRRAEGADFTLLFHDTHHRAISAPQELDTLELDGYDGVLAFGEILAETYRKHGWGRDVHVWHEAADARRFQPMPEAEREGDLVWIGNWGDDERSAELMTYLVEPVRRLGLATNVFGVRYPDEAKDALESAGIRYHGWLPNHCVPEVFARHRATVHVPRRFYVDRLPGIPTIRMFEALACGVPLVSAPWHDVEGLFRTGEDYLAAPTGEGMAASLHRLMIDDDLAESLRSSGRERVLARHTCAHRVDELMIILARIRQQRTSIETGVAQ